MKTRLPARKMQLIQVGIGLAPRLDAETELSYAPRQAMDNMHNGGSYDHYFNRQAPIEIGHFRHTGRYQCCGFPNDCGYVRDELDYINAAKTAYVPMLFYSDVVCCPNPPADCLKLPNCGIYMWAYGKITSINNLFSVQDYLAPTTAEVGFEGILRTPLVATTYGRWRYGPAIDRVYPENLELLEEIESTTVAPYIHIPEDDNDPSTPPFVPPVPYVVESPADWDNPCGLQPCCDDSRFWPRNIYADNLDTGSVQFDYNLWECKWVRVQNTASSRLEVFGNTVPRTRCAIQGNATLRVRNRLGTFDYFYDRPALSQVYTDSWTGVVMERNLAGIESPVAGAPAPPVLDWHENILSIDHGFATVGATDCWIN